MASNLLPCPNPGCGGTPRSVWSIVRVHFQCTLCRTSGPETGRAKGENGDDTAEEAAKLWNRLPRRGDAEKARLDERVRCVALINEAAAWAWTTSLASIKAAVLDERTPRENWLDAARDEVTR